MKKHYFCLLVLILSLHAFAQQPPGPPVPPPQGEQAETDHSEANEKLAREIEEAIDGMRPLRDADKIEILKKILKHIRDNKKAEPSKNLEDAIKKALQRGERTPDWLKDLAKKWRRTLGLPEDPPDRGWRDLAEGLRVSRVILEPIIYEAGPEIEPNVHAYFTFEMMPGTEMEFLNVRLTDPATGLSLWLVDNIPLLPFDEPQIISYTINVEDFGADYEYLICAYDISTEGQEDPEFEAIGSVELEPEPTIYYVPSGSSDPALSLGDVPAFQQEIGRRPRPGRKESLKRGCRVPNIDLDSSTDPSDHCACGPAAAANSLHWLVRQHQELAGDTTSLRAKLDSLKIYMNRDSRKGVRFDSMVVGKLTIIDALKLPIKVKYKTKHESGNKDEPLASTKPPRNTAENHGKLGHHPDFDWLKKEMDDGEDVELHVGWYGRPDRTGKRERKGGHWVVVTGYVKGPNRQGIYIKDDTRQNRQGGLRHKYYRWGTLPDGTPYLRGLRDSRGNIAIVESVVSESYDPSVTFETDTPQPGYMSPAWQPINITGTKMKPGYPFTETKSRFPWLWVGGGVAGAAVLTYILLSDSDSPDCSFTLAAETTSASCGLNNGRITIVPSASGAYSYQWSHGATGADVTNLAAGTYTVTATRTGTDCSNTLSVQISDADLVFNVDLNITASGCSREDGAIAVSVSPSGTYTYLWSDGATSATRTGLAPGSYTLTVSAGGTCTESVTATVNELPADFELTFDVTDADCGTANGSAIVSVSPAGTYDYLWSSGDTGPQVTGLPAGEYQVTVSIPGTECVQTASITVNELPPVFDIMFTTTGSNCDMPNGSASVSVDPPAEYVFVWSTGDTGPEIAGLSSGEYQVTVTLAGTECAQSASVSIEDLPPTFTITPGTTPADCGVNNGTATVSVEPPGEYDFIWSNGATTQEVTGLPMGTYEVTVSVSGNPACAQTSTVTIDALSPPFTVTVTGIDVTCGATDDGSATVIVDPPGEYTYLWSTGDTDPEISGLTAGTYDVSVTAIGTTCTVAGSVTIAVEGPYFVLTFTTTLADCGVANGSATVVPDPPGDYTYHWSNGGTETTIDNVSPGTYTVTVTDMAGCSNTTDITVSELTPGYITDISPVPGNCLGEGADIILVLETAGDGPMQIEAHGPDGPHVIETPPGIVQLSEFITVLPGSWQITVRDLSVQAGECFSQAEIEVDDTTVIDAADDMVETLVNQSVSGNVLDNDTGLELQVTNHSQPTGGSVTVDAAGNFTFTPPPGMIGEFFFQYTVTDACGNTDAANVVIHVIAEECLFEVTFTVTPEHCGAGNGTITTLVLPPSMYAYQWSEGSTTPDLENLVTGLYTLTVTLVEFGCQQIYDVIVEEVPADYVESITTMPGNCTGEGEITITLTTPGDGPLTVIIDGPDGSAQLSLDPGQHNLSSFINIPSGDYSITVYDEAAGPACAEISEVTVQDNTPPVIANEDFFETGFEMPVGGNVLLNDSGLDISVIQVSQIVGGLVEWTPDGNFIYTPNPGFSGIGLFNYTITDVCGNTATTFAQITVAAPVCEFTVQFVNTNASCGLSNGTAFVIPDPPGSYHYEWSTGQTGQQLINASAGMYSVTIEDVALGCSLEFDTQVGEDPAMYISNVEVTQPDCPVMGDIQFQASTPGSGPLVLIVLHPNGTDEFIIAEGQVTLSEFLSISDGDYIISVIDESAGPDCVDGFEATISGTVTIEIALEAVFPPSDPTAEDGGMIVGAVMPGELPYTILLNGDNIGLALDHFFEIFGLGAGEYTVQVIDDNGCLSNILVVEIPLPGSLQLELGMGIATMPVMPVAFREQPAAMVHNVIRPFIDASVTFKGMFGRQQELRMAWFPPDVRTGFDQSQDGTVGIFRAQHLTSIWNGEIAGMELGLRGGFAIDLWSQDVWRQHWVIQGNATYRMNKFMRAYCGVALQGWDRIEMPLVEFGVRMPVVREVFSVKPVTIGQLLQRHTARKQ